MGPVKTHVTPDGSIHTEWTGRTNASPLATWAAFSDTDQLNRIAGFKWTFTARDAPDGGVEREGHLRWLGMKQTWQERPYRWVAPREYGVERVFRGGPIQGYRTHMTLEPMPSTGGTALTFRMIWWPRYKAIARILAKSVASGSAQLGIAMSQTLGRLEGTAVGRLGGPPPLPTSAVQRLDERLPSRDM